MSTPTYDKCQQNVLRLLEMNEKSSNVLPSTYVSLWIEHLQCRKYYSKKIKDSINNTTPCKDKNVDHRTLTSCLSFKNWILKYHATTITVIGILPLPLFSSMLFLRKDVILRRFFRKIFK